MIATAATTIQAVMVMAACSASGAPLPQSHGLRDYVPSASSSTSSCRADRARAFPPRSLEMMDGHVVLSEPDRSTKQLKTPEHPCGCLLYTSPSPRDS